MMIDSNVFRALNIDCRVVNFVLRAEEELAEVFTEIDSIEAANQLRVLQTFRSERIAQRHFSPTTGYGYDDIGRDTLDRVFAQVFGTDDALVRPQFANGTHALFTALSGLLTPGKTMLSITGKPYDTLEQAIGIDDTKNTPGSLRESGIMYRQTELLPDGTIDIDAVMNILRSDSSIKVVYAQRSRGYSWRNAMTIDTFKRTFARIKSEFPDVWIMVDNCYGEFTQLQEPTHVGADVIAGSLIKNPGGGIAPTGGYIAGTNAAIARIEHRWTIPGTGREVGSYAASYAPFFQGLFLAPHVTAQSLKSAALFARVFENAGMVSLPASTDMRSDIIQSVRFPNADSLIAFCRSIQKASPIDSFVVPEPWDMPGYTHPVIMAAGTFVQGASIELSADAPIREPYIAYIQGALTYAHGRIAVMEALNALIQAGQICLK